jgi:hypothetical protein
MGISSKEAKMNVALNVALQQQHNRYAAQNRAGSYAESSEPEQLYLGVYQKQACTKNGKIIVGTWEAWRRYFKYAKLVAVPHECKGYAFIQESE